MVGRKKNKDILGGGCRRGRRGMRGRSPERVRTGRIEPA